MKTLLSFLAAAAFLTAGLPAQVPQIINFQGRVAVGATNFNGSGSFKFALVNAAGTTTYWSNDGTSTAGSQPTAAVSLTVTKGLYSVLLGDATLPNMTVIPATVFANSDVRLRVWFNDGANGSQLLTPDQRLAAVGYAMIASTVPDGAISSAKIAAGAVTSSQIANGAVGGGHLASGLTLGGTTAGTFSGPLTGNVTGNVSGSAASFTGPLTGDVTGPQGATVVAKVGTSTAANVHAAELLANAATNANAAGAIVKRDASGNFAAGAITAGAFSGPLTGNVTGNVSGSAASFTGSLAGDVTGTQAATVIANVGGSPAANLHNADVLANGATPGPIPNALVRRDSQAGFYAGTIRCWGNLDLEYASSPTEGTILQGAGTLLHTYGTENTFLGFNAGNFTMTGIHITGTGYLALNANTIGGYDTAIGWKALAANTSGNYNTAIGDGALTSNTTGSANVAIGSSALRNNRIGGLNIAIGDNALATQSFDGVPLLASANVAIGSNALFKNQPTSANNGISNVGIGFDALFNNTTGSGNIALGDLAGIYLTTGNNNIAIGHYGVPGESNIIRIGDGTTQTDTYLTGTVHTAATFQGTGDGTEEPPDKPIITRRIRSTIQSLNSVVARTDKLALERDNTKGGFLIRYVATPGNTTIAATGLTSTGAAISFYQALPNPGTAGTVTLWTDAQNVAYYRLQFGNTYNAAQQTTVEISRYSNTDNYWTGVLTSTVNQ